MCRQGILRVGCRSNAFSVLYARLLGGISGFEENDLSEKLSSSLREHEENRNTLRGSIMTEINSTAQEGNSLTLLEYINDNPANVGGAINENIRDSI